MCAALATFRINVSFGCVGGGFLLWARTRVFLGRVVPELELVLPVPDGRGRRLVPGIAARAAGEAGPGLVPAQLALAGDPARGTRSRRWRRRPGACGSWRPR